jgi:hypothetical protein
MAPCLALLAVESSNGGGLFALGVGDGGAIGLAFQIRSPNGCTSVGDSSNGRHASTGRSTYSTSASSTDHGPVHVRGYYRRDGTSMRSHTWSRARPDDPRLYVRK